MRNFAIQLKFLHTWIEQFKTLLIYYMYCWCIFQNDEMKSVTQTKAGVMVQGEEQVASVQSGPQGSRTWTTLEG